MKVKGILFDGETITVTRVQTIRYEPIDLSKESDLARWLKDKHIDLAWNTWHGYGYGRRGDKWYELDLREREIKGEISHIKQYIKRIVGDKAIPEDSMECYDGDVVLVDAKTWLETAQKTMGEF